MDRVEMPSHINFKFSPRNPTSVSGSLRRTLTHQFNPLARPLPAANMRYGLSVSLLDWQRSRSTSQLRNFGTEHPFSCCYESYFAITWKDSLTSISPPICTSTQGSLIRTIQRAVSAASPERNTPHPNSRNGFDVAAASRKSNKCLRRGPHSLRSSATF
jgi:hypothetical protein